MGVRSSKDPVWNPDRQVFTKVVYDADEVNPANNSSVLYKEQVRDKWAKVLRTDPNGNIVSLGEMIDPKTGNRANHGIYKDDQHVWRYKKSDGTYSHYINEENGFLPIQGIKGGDASCFAKETFTLAIIILVILFLVGLIQHSDLLLAASSTCLITLIYFKDKLRYC